MRFVALPNLPAVENALPVLIINRNQPERQETGLRLRRISKPVGFAYNRLIGDL